MSIGLIGRKAGMTQVFQADGTMVAVSVVAVAPNRVTRVRTLERDGYAAVQLGTDASGFDPEGQLPPIPETNASKSGRQRLVDAAARGKLTVRQLAERVGGYGGLSFVGTPQTIAEHAMPALKPSFYKLDRSADVFSWDAI